MIRNTNTLLLDCAIKYLPDEVVRFHTFEKFLKDEKNKKYVTLRLKDMLVPHGLAILKEKSVFRKRLYAMKNCNRYLLLKLVAMLAGVLMAIGYFIPGLIRSFRINEDEEYFTFFLASTAAGVQIGDCVLSLVLRTKGSKGLLVRDFHFYKTWIVFMSNFYSTVIFSKVLAWLHSANKYFYSHETTYQDEAVRRILLKIGFREIRYDLFKHESDIMPVLYGYEIRNKAYRRLHLDKISYDLEKAEKKIRDLVYRNETYGYMRGADIDLSTRLDISDMSQWGNERIAVIYLHAVSDAQYFYGVDCFTDLHDWLMKTLALLGELEIKVCIKLHPSYFSDMHNYPVDREYLIILEMLFGLSIDQIIPSKPAFTSRSNVWFLHHSVSLLELSKVFKNFLCITHHGTVVTEAAYLGHTAICSAASPYIRGIDTFVLVYESREEYTRYIRAWKLNAVLQSVEQRKSLFSYVYETYFIMQPNPIALVFAKVAGIRFTNYTKFNKELDQLLSSISESDILFNKIELAARVYA